MKIWAAFCCWLKLQVEMLHLSVKFDGPFFLKTLPLFNFLKPSLSRFRVFSRGCRLSFLFLCLALAMNFFVPQPRASQRATLLVDSAYGVEVGSVVVIDISLLNPEGILGCSFELSYDPAIVQAYRAEKGELVKDNDAFHYSLEDNLISVAWAKNDGSSVGEGALLRLSFIALARGSTFLRIQHLSWEGEGAYPYVINGFISTWEPGYGGILEIVTNQFLPGANQGKWYSFSLTAAGGQPPYRWSLVSGNLPSGLSLSSSGIISGTPASPKGNYSATIRVMDDVGVTRSRVFTITVFERDEAPLSITSPSTLSRGRKGSAYSAALAATGGSKPYRWSLISGSLPPGLSLSGTGTISGTPASTGTYNFVARVTDDNYARQEKEFSLTIGDTDYFFEGEAVFRLLAISRGTMKLELTPYDMPYTMVVDRDMDWLELTVYLYGAQEWVRINGASASSGAARTLPLYKGNNQITIGVSPDGYNFRRFILTVYRLP